MNHCLTIEAIARPGALSSLELEHAADCPRCGALLAQYREFVEGRGEVPPAEYADALARLGGFIDRELAVPARADVTPRERSEAAPSRVGRFAGWFSVPMARFAIGVSAVAIIAGGVFVLRARHSESALERGGSGAPLWIAVDADTLAHDVVLRWAPQPGAEGYSIEIVSAELEPLGMFGPVADLSFTLARGAVRTRPTGTRVYARVVAKRAGVTLAESELATLRLP